MEKRFKDILARKEEIRSLLQSGGECDLDAIGAELDGLEKEERSIQKKMAISAKLTSGELRGKIILPPGTKLPEEKRVGGSILVRWNIGLPLWISSLKGRCCLRNSGIRHPPRPTKLLSRSPFSIPLSTK